MSLDGHIPLTETLGNTEWLKKNEQAIKEMFPKTWTHMNNLNGLQLGFKFKLIGIDWRSEEQFSKVMVYLEKIKIILRDGYTIKANPHSIFT
jgi:hypothetical protein